MRLYVGALLGLLAWVGAIAGVVSLLRAGKAQDEARKRALKQRRREWYE